MVDMIDFTDDAILPDDFDASKETYDFGSEEPTGMEAPTTEPTTESNGAEAQGEAQTIEATTPLEPQQMPIPQTIKVKFNHEERELSYDEAAMLAQKGMNYDKLDARVKEFEAGSAKSNRLAKQLGYANVEEMIDAAAENFRNRQIRQLMDDGNTEAMAKFLVDQQMKAEAAEEAKIAQQETPSPAPPKPGLSPERKAELDEFIKAYPGVTKLPDEVIIANRNGVRLLVAYERFKNKANENELAILKQNQAAAARAPVTGATGKASATSKPEADDPFLKGFDSDY